MQKFKPGDRVIRTYQSNPTFSVFKGRLYTVTSYDPDSNHYLKLLGIKGLWAERYFVLDEETFNGNI